MLTLTPNASAELQVPIQRDGRPLALTGTITAGLYSLTGTPLLTGIALDAEATGADWPNGVVVVPFTAEQTADLVAGDYLLVVQGGFGVKRIKVAVEALFEASRASLFIRDVVVDELRADQLLVAAAGALGQQTVSDDYLWAKLRAAEAEVSHRLRVPLVPTHFFPLQPTAEQIAALNGQAWDVDPPHDYHPSMMHFEKWGYLVTRHCPIISVEGMRFAYPSQATGFIDIPHDWIRFDARYGHIRLVPSSPAIFGTMNAFIMTALTGNRSIPFMIQLDYTAGLADAHRDYPELVDCIKKLAVCKVVTDAYMPQSGSISGDGLSQSMSVDASKYLELVEHTLNGPDGTNGGLMAKIHGIRMAVV